MFGIPKTKILFIKFISKEEHITRIKKYCKSFLKFYYHNVNGGIRVKMGLGISEIDALIKKKSDDSTSSKEINFKISNLLEKKYNCSNFELHGDDDLFVYFKVDC